MPSAAPRLYRELLVAFKGVRPTVAITSSLIATVVVIYLTHLWPLLLRKYGPLPLAMHFAAGLMFLSTVLYTYTRAILAPPGYAVMCDEPDLECTEFCFKCGLWRPVGAHHCSICGRCIWRMDHHCLLLGTCIGQQNYRVYFLFLVFLFAGSTFYAASSLGLLRSLPLQNQPLPLIATFALTAGVAICLGPLIIFHTVLLTLGMSTLDALASCEKSCCGARSLLEACNCGWLLFRMRTPRRAVLGPREV